MKLAIFGGTFDPIHSAHLTVALEAADRFQIDRVLFIPAEAPPHKAGGTHAPYEDRVRMAEIACAVDPRFAVSRLEEGTARSYSIETIGKVRAMMSPRDQLFFIIGADAFADIRTWYRWRDVVNQVSFIVVSRPGCTYDVPVDARVEELDGVDLPVSSSEIRRALAAGERPTVVPQGVMQYILEHGLYGSSVAA